MSFIVQACKVIFFLCVLPCWVTYFQLCQTLFSTKLVRLQASTTQPSNTAAAGLYAAAMQHKNDNYYHRLTLHGDAMTLSKELLRNNNHQSLYSLQDTGDDQWCLYRKEKKLDCTTRTSSSFTVHPVAVTSSFFPSSFLHHNSNIQFVVEQVPATALIILLNIGLAYTYWDRRVLPHAVAKLYDPLLHHEPWRCFTGSTAHFEPWHLAINMMSMSALGQELEGRRLYSSVEFLFLNITLMPLVSLVWMVFQWITLQRYERMNSPESYQPSPTVGYSGVLFAWMVVASSEQQSTCPVIFLPSLCFPTYTILGKLKFSMSPLVQLIVMQFILPRVSFFGHLAGIVVGFVVYWGMLPLSLAQPAVLIPGLYVIYLKVCRKISLGTGNSTAPEVKPQRNLLLALLVVLVASILVLGSISFALGLALSSFYWFLLYRRQEDDESAPILGKGFLVSAVLVLVTDWMAVGIWFALGSATLLSVGVVLLRAIVLLCCCVCVLRQSCIVQDEGILGITLGYTTLRPCHAIAQQVWPALEVESGAPQFGGSGQRLGGGGRRPDQVDRRELSRLV